MDLTERRKQFLQGLIDLYRRTQLPVHYAQLAKMLGVSKWTAYDMLQELEKLGYLTRDYALGQTETGRSQVVFAPTRLADDLFTRLRSSVPGEEELADIRIRVLRVLNQMKDLSPSDAVQRMLQELPRVELRVSFCAYVLGMLVVHMRGLGDQMTGLVQRFVQSAPVQETRLVVFVGAVVGTALDRLGSGFSADVVELAGKYLKTVSELTERERSMLADLLEDALSRHLSGAGA